MARIITDQAKIDELLTRGVEEIIDKEHLRNALLSGKQLRIKLGNDPTSPNIHIGRAIPLWKLRAFQELGHKIIFIVGDYTALIGDTSDKDSERPMLSETEIKKNEKSYFNQAFKILDKKNTETHYNSEWLKKIDLKSFGEMANLFGLHEFESREVIARRMKAGKRVSFHELLYPLMQAYDSVAVKANIELGGTDQRFNLLTGRRIQEFYRQKPQDIMMTTLIEGLDGRKMSSSWGNTVNLTDSPDQMFGKIMSLKDELVEKYWTLCTDIPVSEIKNIILLSARDSKIKLAKKIVEMYHGEKSAEKAETEFIKVFSEKGAPSDIKTVKLNKKEIALADLIFETGLAKSKSEARRLIEQGGVKINDDKKTNPHEKINLSNEVLVQVGPRKFLKVKNS